MERGVQEAARFEPQSLPTDYYIPTTTRVPMSLIIRDTHDPGHNKLDLGVTVDEAVSFIAETLEDPLNPRWCGPCITACMVVIQLHHDTAEVVINKHHILGSTIVAFLTAKRSIADIEALASRWSKCRCSIAEISSHASAGRLHYIVVGMMPVLAKISASHRAVGRFGDKVDVLGVVVENFARFFMDAVSKVKPFSVAKGRHPEIWPTTPTDLIPYGVQLRNQRRLRSNYSVKQVLRRR